MGLFPSNYVQGLSEQQQSTEATRCACPREYTPPLSCFPSSALMTVPLPFFSLSDHFTGADSVTSDVLNTVSDQERKRQEAIFEVVTSERHYVGSLNLVQEVRSCVALSVVTFPCQHLVLFCSSRCSLTPL